VTQPVFISGVWKRDWSITKLLFSTENRSY